MMAKLPIVLVEDDPMIREGLQDFLEAEGYAVIAAENGREGLEAIRARNGKCFVLLDLQMPVMTGEQLLEALANEPTAAIRNAPVLVLSARAEPLTGHSIVDFMRKPINLDRLLEHVRSTCG